MKQVINILLVEDNLADAELIEEILADANFLKYVVAAVERLSEALKLLKKKQFDVILLDLSLPDSHGLNTLERVVLAAPDLPVLVLTGLTDRELAVKAVRQGAQDYLVKGKFDCDLLLRAISYARERKETLEKLRQSEERYHQLAAKLDLQVQERTAQLQKALEVEAMLKRITDKVRDSLDPNQIIETAVQELVNVTGAYFAQVSLYDPKTNNFEICYEATDRSKNKLEELLKYSPNGANSCCGSCPLNLNLFPQLHKQFMQGECLQFSYLMDSPYEERETILACPLKHVLLDKKKSIEGENQPLSHTESLSKFTGETTILGYLWLRHNSDYVFSDLEVELVQQVASQCAIALRQAQLYQASLTQVKELERLHQLKDDFLSTVCHELRTPMANIKMALDMLQILSSQPTYLALSSVALGNKADNVISRSPTQNSRPYSIANSSANNLANATTAEKMEAYLKMAQVECDREIKLINDLLDLQRLDAKVDPLDGIPLQLQNWLPHITEVFQLRIAQSQHILEIAIDPDLPPLVTDPTALGRVVSEMLQNACKYTPENPGETIRLSANCDRHKLYLSVSNSGVEIAESEFAHIFDKFYRIPSKDPWKQGGTGLGLALAQKLVSYLGGEISVQSGNGKTTFTLEFPL